MANDRNVDEQYRSVLRDVLENGVAKGDRTGTGTRSVFGRMLRFDMAQGFPLVTLKKTNFRPVVHELLWMLDSVDASYRERGFGPHNIKYLCDNDVAIWNEWPHKRYVEQNTDLDYLVRELDADGKESYRDYTLKEFAARVKADDEFARLWGGLGPVYGEQWRRWKGRQDGSYPAIVDQVQDAVDLLRSNPDSRRIMVTAWNPGEVQDQLLPPCHYGFQYWTREMDLGERLQAAGIQEIQVAGTYAEDEWELAIEAAHKMLDGQGVPRRRLSMMFQMRSVDLFLGWAFDVASYALQLHVMAQQVNMVPDELIICSGDTHIYANHLEQAAQAVELPAYPLPKLTIARKAGGIGDYRFDDFQLEGYQSGPFIRAQVAV